MATRVGNNANNKIDGTFNADLLSGLGGNDTLTGFDGNDTLKGGSGNDKLYGDDPTEQTIGRDKLLGGSGNDKLYGGFGNDTLNGGSGDDKLYAGGGEYRDTLIGGTGKDKFYFTGIGEDVPGHNALVIIKDFTIGDDKIVMKYSGGLTFGDLNIEYIGNDAIISSPNGNSGEIKLLGVHEGGAELHASDFTFT